MARPVGCSDVLVATQHVAAHLHQIADPDVSIAVAVEDGAQHSALPFGMCGFLAQDLA